MRTNRGRMFTFAALAAAAVWLVACDPPTTFPGGADASCFELVDSYNDQDMGPTGTLCASGITKTGSWTDNGDGTFTYTSTGTGDNVTCPPGSAANIYVYKSALCDDRLNFQHGDLVAVLYPRHDENGNPNLHVYCVGDEGAYFGFAIPGSAFTSVASPPAKNTQVFASNACGVWVKAFVLATGEFQINIGNDGGKIDVIIFEGLPPNNVHYQFLDPGA